VHQEEHNPFRTGGLVQNMECFNFVFVMKMMMQILRITNDLSLFLQGNDQNIVQAMSLIANVRTCLIGLRNEGWELLFEEKNHFVLQMKSQYEI
jgi:hypothetical protein